MRGIFTAYFDFWRRAFDFKGRTNRFDWFFAGIIDLIIRIFLGLLISTKLNLKSIFGMTMNGGIAVEWLISYHM